VAHDIRNGYVTDSVFVSYSRDDSRMATVVVQLLRARDDVFYDIDSIPAGERWRDALLRAIDNATHFYLLWCMHSAGSEEVEREWRRAISGNKRLVPVLLDSTPLVEPLTDYQWVDFQGVVQGHKPLAPAVGRDFPGQATPVPPPRARARPRLANPKVARPRLAPPALPRSARPGLSDPKLAEPRLALPARPCRARPCSASPRLAGP